jgi:hypothetical protein
MTTIGLSQLGGAKWTIKVSVAQADSTALTILKVKYTNIIDNVLLMITL